MGAVVNAVAGVWPVAQPYVASAVRHGLTAGGVYLATKGVPGLDDATVSWLTATVMGAIGLGWSAIEKAKR